MQVIIWAVIVVGSVILDQWTKMLAVRDLMPIRSTVLLDGILGLRYVENTGAAFGMLKGQRWFFIILSTAAIIAISIYLVKCRKTVPPLLGISLAMIVGGGIGNQIDRIANGYVVDFLEFLFMDFAIFNVADCFVTVGAFLVIFDLLFIDRHYLLEETDVHKKLLDGTKKGATETDSTAVTAESTPSAEDSSCGGNP
jgi:signal peptidase II